MEGEAYASLVREAYVAVLNDFPLVIPAAIFVAALFTLAPVIGVEYALIAAVVVAAKLTEAW